MKLLIKFVIAGNILALFPFAWAAEYELATPDNVREVAEAFRETGHYRAIVLVRDCESGKQVMMIPRNRAHNGVHRRAAVFGGLVASLNEMRPGLRGGALFPDINLKTGEVYLGVHGRSSFRSGKMNGYHGHLEPWFAKEMFTHAAGSLNLDVDYTSEEMFRAIRQSYIDGRSTSFSEPDFLPQNRRHLCIGSLSYAKEGSSRYHRHGVYDLKLPIKAPEPDLPAIDTGKCNLRTNIKINSLSAIPLGKLYGEIIDQGLREASPEAHHYVASMSKEVGNYLDPSRIVIANTPLIETNVGGYIAEQVARRLDVLDEWGSAIADRWFGRCNGIQQHY